MSELVSVRVRAYMSHPFSNTNVNTAAKQQSTGKAARDAAHPRPLLPPLGSAQKTNKQTNKALERRVYSAARSVANRR